MAETTAGSLLEDPNFIQLLAGIGSRLGGKDSVAEALGQPTIAFSQALAAQRAGAKVAAQPQPTIRRYSDLTDRLGNLTPKGTPGPSSLSINKDGSYSIEGDLHPDTIDTTPQSTFDPTLNAYSTSPNTRRFSLGGQAPTQEELDDTLNYPFARATPSRSAEGVANAPSAIAVATPSRAPTPQAPLETLTAEDLRGLNPEQVNQAITNSLRASQIETQVLGLAGRDITDTRTHQRLVAEAARREAATTATALATAKQKTAEAIAASNLLPQDQERLFQRLDAAQTLEQARGELINASKLPPRVTSAQERDDYARQQFNGRSYGQLQPAEQAEVNARILREKATYQIVPTETGLFRINQKTGDVFQVHGPTGSVGVTPAPTGGVRTPPRGGARVSEAPGGTSPADEVQGYETRFRQMGPDAAKKEVDTILANPGIDATTKSKVQQGYQQSQGPVAPKPLAYGQLSPFAQEVSDPNAATPIFGAKPPTSEQAKAQGFGSQALQAHEVIRDLEQHGEFGTASGLAIRNTIRNLSRTEAAAIGAVPGAAIGAVVGGPAGAAVGGAIGGGLTGFGVKLATPLLNAFDTDAQRAYMQGKANFIGAVLRKESGAAISAEEFLREDQRYFPQPGDSSEVIANKTRARETAIRGIQAEAGRKLLPPQVVPFQGAPSAPSTPAASTPEEYFRNLQKAPTPPEPDLSLPRTPESQRRMAPGQTPTATLPVEHMKYLTAIRGFGSKAILEGVADPYMQEVGAETLAQQMSYFTPTQRAAIRSRMKKLGLQ